MAGKTGKATSTTTDLAISASGSAGDVLSQGYYMQAGSTYAVIAGAQVTVAGATAANAASLWILDSVDGVGQTRIVRAHNSADVTPIWWLRVVTPTEQMAPLDAADAAWHRQRHGGVRCPRLPQARQRRSGVTNDSVVTTTSTTYQGWPVGHVHGGERRDVAGAGLGRHPDEQLQQGPDQALRRNHGVRPGRQHVSRPAEQLLPLDGGADLHLGGIDHRQDSVRITGTAPPPPASRTSALWPCCCRHPRSARLPTIPRPAPPAPASRRASPPPIPPLAADHLVISRPGPRARRRTSRSERAFTAGGSLMLDAGAMAPNAGTDDVECGLFAVDAGVSAGSRSWTLDWKSDGTNTGRMMSARLIAMALQHDRAHGGLAAVGLDLSMGQAREIEVHAYGHGRVETLREIVAKRRSIARGGDGEWKIAHGASIKSQDADPELARRIREVLRSDDERLLVGIPNIWSGARLPHDKARFGRPGAMTDLPACWSPASSTGRAFITRPDRLPDRLAGGLLGADAARGIAALLVTGSGKGRRFLPMLANASSTALLDAPRRNAWSQYGELYSACRDFGRANPDGVVVLSLGPTATVLAADLAADGYQALDLGHSACFGRARRLKPTRRRECDLALHTLRRISLFHTLLRIILRRADEEKTSTPVL